MHCRRSRSLGLTGAIRSKMRATPGMPWLAFRSMERLTLKPKSELRCIANSRASSSTTQAGRDDPYQFEASPEIKCGYGGSLHQAHAADRDLLAEGRRRNGYRDPDMDASGYAH